MLTNIIDYLRFTLVAVLVVLGMMLFEAWMKDHPAQTTNTVQTHSAISNNYIPEVTSSSANTTDGSIHPVVPAEQTNSPAPITSPHLIHVTTDVLNVDIDAVGGNITQVKLIKYPKELHSSEPVTLLNNDPDERYIAQSGLLSTIGPDTSKGQALYTATQTSYVLPNGQNEIKVDLHWQDANDVKVTKTFTFQRDNYEVGVRYQVENKST